MLLNVNEALFNPYKFIKHWSWYPFTDLYGNPTADTPGCRRLKRLFITVLIIYCGRGIRPVYPASSKQCLCQALFQD
jgi:hypothetical protein